MTDTNVQYWVELICSIILIILIDALAIFQVVNTLTAS